MRSVISLQDKETEPIEMLINISRAIYLLTIWVLLKKSENITLILCVPTSLFLPPGPQSPFAILLPTCFTLSLCREADPSKWRTVSYPRCLWQPTKGARSLHPTPPPRTRAWGNKPPLTQLVLQVNRIQGQSLLTPTSPLRFASWKDLIFCSCTAMGK